MNTKIVYYPSKIFQNDQVFKTILLSWMLSVILATQKIDFLVPVLPENSRKNSQWNSLPILHGLTNIITYDNALNRQD